MVLVVRGKMVRKQSTSKRAKKSSHIESRVTRSNSIAAEKTKKSAELIKKTQIKSKIIPHAKNIPENSTKRVTRSNSVRCETPTSDTSTFPLQTFSPKRTRSKSEKISNIDLHSNFDQGQKSEQKKKKSDNLQISVNRYVNLSNFCVDSIVLAKQKNSFPWPAKVLVIEEKKVFVFFYGDKRSGYVDKTEIYDFILSLNAVKNKLNSKRIQKTYVTGVREVELLLRITHE